jgi:hypothetical protein
MPLKRLSPPLDGVSEGSRHRLAKTLNGPHIAGLSDVAGRELGVTQIATSEVIRVAM